MSNLTITRVAANDFEHYRPGLAELLMDAVRHGA